MRGKAIVRGPQGPQGPQGPKGSGGTYAAQFVVDAFGLLLQPGTKGDLYFPFDCEITGWTVLADRPGSIAFELWSDAYGNYPPGETDDITAGQGPALSNGIKAQGGVAQWDAAIAEGTTLRVHVTSVSNLTRCTLALTVAR